MSIDKKILAINIETLEKTCLYDGTVRGYIGEIADEVDAEIKELKGDFIILDYDEYQTEIKKISEGEIKEEERGLGYLDLVLNEKYIFNGQDEIIPVKNRKILIFPSNYRCHIEYQNDEYIMCSSSENEHEGWWYPDVEAVLDDNLIQLFGAGNYELVAQLHKGNNLL